MGAFGTRSAQLAQRSPSSSLSFREVRFTGGIAPNFAFELLRASTALRLGLEHLTSWTIARKSGS